MKMSHGRVNFITTGKKLRKTNIVHCAITFYKIITMPSQPIISKNSSILLFFSGELREEIQVQSNAILTIERRADRRADLVQQRNLNAEVCVSKIGFIIALVITALLALVAVAIAVSCWLMAYKRRPKTTGPLPHPPEFPNPLFTTPEPLAEPTPDYLH